MVSLGEELKRERELRDISLREISDATKISVRILEAIEHDNYKILPGGVFNRNFLRAYAGFIGLDPEAIVRKYQMRHPDGSAEEVPAGLTPFEGGSAPAGKKRMLVLAALGVLLLLIVAVVVYFRMKSA